MMALIGASDGGKGLEGRADGGDEEGKKVHPREFFWDSIVLYVVAAVIGLASIDALTEFIRGSDVECIFNSTETSKDLGDAQAYVNSVCSGSLPVTEFFPAFIVIHGILIAAPHYLWQNHFGGTLEFFFQLVSSLERLREESGEYPKENFDIIEQLQIALTTYNRNRMYWLYFLKLLIQLVLSAAALGLAIAYFQDFDSTFICPRNLEETQLFDWPLPPNQTATCVFTSLRFLAWIRLADVVLLALVVFGLLWSVVWSVSAHVQELGHAKVAKFSFETGLASRYYVPKRVPDYCRCCHRFLHWLSGFVPLLDVYGPRIVNDLDFLIMKLYRSDGGLAYVFNEVQTLRAIRALNDDERRRLGLHVRNQNELIDSESVHSDLQWRIDQSPKTNWQQIGDNQIIEVPDSVRGAVLGFAASAAHCNGALCLSFGSPSLGFPHALGRVFGRVGSINFHPYYTDPVKKVTGQSDTSGVVQVTCSDDILTGDNYIEFTTSNLVNEIWFPGITHGTPKRDVLTDFIVVGPIAKYAHLHKTTVNLFLGMFRDCLSDNAVLLTIRPMKIAGKDVTAEFLEYRPPESIFPEIIEVGAMVPVNKKETFVWPPQTRASTASSNKLQPSPASQSGYLPGGSQLQKKLRKKYQPPQLTLRIGERSNVKLKFTVYSQQHRPTPIQTPTHTTAQSQTTTPTAQSQTTTPTAQSQTTKLPAQSQTTKLPAQSQTTSPTAQSQTTKLPAQSQTTPSSPTVQAAVKSPNTIPFTGGVMLQPKIASDVTITVEDSKKPEA